MVVPVCRVFSPRTLASFGRGVAALVGLAVERASGRHRNLERAREGVDDGGADAVEAAGDLVAAAAELAARVERGQHRLDGREAGLLVLADRDAAPVVLDADAAVGVDGDVDAVAEAGHRLVDGVVHDLVDQVVEPTLVGGPDVHAGSPAHGLQALEDLDVLGGVAAVAGRLAVAGAIRRRPVGAGTRLRLRGLLRGCAVLTAALRLRLLPGCGHEPSLVALRRRGRAAAGTRHAEPSHRGSASGSERVRGGLD